MTNPVNSANQGTPRVHGRLATMGLVEGRFPGPWTASEFPTLRMCILDRPLIPLPPVLSGGGLGTRGLEFTRLPIWRNVLCRYEAQVEATKRL
jgi:hypothetical protein